MKLRQHDSLVSSYISNLLVSFNGGSEEILSISDIEDIIEYNGLPIAIDDILDIGDSEGSIIVLSAEGDDIVEGFNIEHLHQLLLSRYGNIIKNIIQDITDE